MCKSAKRKEEEKEEITQEQAFLGGGAESKNVSQLTPAEKDKFSCKLHKTHSDLSPSILLTSETHDPATMTKTANEERKVHTKQGGVGDIGG